ncbi:MAG: glycosyltransferase family 2 protein [Bacteroidetes bacterium]|nr:glycosyltransferase family 2 protein [Fibrella sp.]
MEKLAIVILNFNGQAFLERFLPSVIKHTPGEFSIWVADNGSTDGSLPLVRARFPGVRILELPTNEGYAGGYNSALAQIRAEYYVLLNSDVEVSPGWIEPVLNLLETNPAIAACQPKIRAFDQRDAFEYAGAAGGYLDWLGFAFCRGRLFDTTETDRGQYDTDQPVFWASGACLFVRASVFRQTGGFDASFFAHHEEIDWCWRVQRLGYEVWTCGRSVVYHVGGGTLPASNPHKTYLNYRNSLWMLYKNLPAGRLWSTLILRLIVDGLSSVRFLRAGQFGDIGAILRAHGAFYGRIGQLRAVRRALLAQDTANGERLMYPQSIVWEYFVQGKKRFSELRWVPPKGPTRL